MLCVLTPIFCRKTGSLGILIVYDSLKVRFIHSWCVINALKVLSICMIALISSFLGGRCACVFFLLLRCRLRVWVCCCGADVSDVFVMLLYSLWRCISEYVL